MDSGTLGALIGCVLGLGGGAIGTYVEFRRAQTARQRRGVALYAGALWLVVISFVAGWYLLPATYHPWLWPVYGIALFVAVRYASWRREADAGSPPA